MNVFVTSGSTQVALQFGAGYLVAANGSILPPSSRPRYQMLANAEGSEGTRVIRNRIAGVLEFLANAGYNPMQPRDKRKFAGYNSPAEGGAGGRLHP